MTIKEQLSDARKRLKSKMRIANSADLKAYRKANAVKGVKIGNNRKRRKRKEVAVETTSSGLSPAGRPAGEA